MNLLSEMARAAWQAREDRFPARVRIKFEERFIEDDAQVVLMLRAALSAARDRGWVLVPVEPDEAMVKGALSRCKLALGANVAREMLKTAISAAPSIEGDG